MQLIRSDVLCTAKHVLKMELGHCIVSITAGRSANVHSRAISSLDLELKAACHAVPVGLIRSCRWLRQPVTLPW